jgi:hypothetical protein
MAYATERALVLFGSYRRGDANDPDRYVAAIAKVLSGYETNLIHEVTDPETGISATEKYMSFMPNAGELKVYCDGVAAVRDRIQRLGSLPRPDFDQKRLPRLPAGPGDLATVFVPISHPRYAALVDWTKTADTRLWKFDGRPGIYVSYDTWDQRPTSTRNLGEIAKPIIEQSAPPAQPAHEAAE